MTDRHALHRLSCDVRIDVLDMILRAKGGHTGGSLSAVDLVLGLYADEMNIPSPEDPDRDRFVMSKGHSVEALYAVLAARGLLDRDELLSYGEFGTRLYGHPTMKVPGVEMPTGALGHGLSVGVGMALGGRAQQRSYRVYVLMGDGELAEGSVWEAAACASHYGLDNLVAIVDFNGLQISGAVEDVMHHGSMRQRWESVGWHVVETDGHSFEEIRNALNDARATRGRPSVIIAHTTKGKGVSFMENDPAWHHRLPTAEQHGQAVRELRAMRDRAEAQKVG